MTNTVSCLAEEIVQALDNAWFKVQSYASRYYKV